MRKITLNFVVTFALAVSFALIPLTALAQNSNSSTGEMKQTGSEVGKAGKSMGRNVRRGRVLRGGKHFGKHMGRSGKHFGRGTKKFVKKVIS